MGAEEDRRGGELRPDDALMHALVRRGAGRYFAARRARVADFARRTFSLRGTLALHRRALGWDIARAPANLVLAAPHVAMLAAAPLAARLGAGGLARRLRRGVLLETDVAREVGWRITTDLLELPCRQGRRVAARDALLTEILSDPLLLGRLEAPLRAIGRAAGDAGFRRRLEEAMLAYAGTRAAAAEISAGLLTLGAGALTVKHLTPGALTLGPILASLVAQQAAIASFPLGAALGGVWYGWFPANPSFALTGGITAGLMGGAAISAAFAGIIADPLQQALGLHEQRLRRLLTALERHFADPGGGRFLAHEQYLARLIDVIDILAGAWRLAAH